MHGSIPRHPGPLCQHSPSPSARRLGGLASVIWSLGVLVSCGSGDAEPAGSSAGGGGASSGAGGSGAGAGSPSAAEAGPTAVPELALRAVASGLDRPVFLTQAQSPDAPILVVEQPGRVVALVAGEAGELVAQAPVALDLSEQVRSNGNEQGLLGLALHPDFEENGLLYVNYTTEERAGYSAGTSLVSEFQVQSLSPFEIDPNSERVLISVPQPQSNHNGGCLQFGDDDMLYIGFGDGGGADDEHGEAGNGQNLQTLLGKMLRLDVDGRDVEGAYGIPEGNFAEVTGTDALPEIWSIGWRNPWRFSFDRQTGGMYVGDVGQNSLEEVSFEPAGASGKNYGWRLMEAERCFNPETGCDAARQNLVLPVASYGRDMETGGVSITGGYVYRGSDIEELTGTYLYTDFVSGNFWALRLDPQGTVLGAPTRVTEQVNPERAVRQFSSFGQDAAGELYVLSFQDGTIYRLAPRQ